MKIILEVDDALGKAIIQTSSAKELVLCLNCKHNDGISCKWHSGPDYEWLVSPEDYCSVGERNGHTDGK